VRIDHVIYVTADLDGAAARIDAELGLVSVPGGRHAGLGTHNRIVPLGAGYLELMAVADAAEAAGSELGRRVLAHLDDRGEGLFAWCVAVDDVDAHAARLGTGTMRIAREGLTARLTGLEQALEDPSLPFFITRDDAVPDPGLGAEAGGITWVEVGGDPDGVREHIGGADLPVRFADGPPRVVAMGIGQRELRS
jgi:hypothetical protein